jgi:DNA polymerase/3'-5' exonuclease PolX
MTVDIKKLHDAGELETVEGIGSSSRKIIADYITTGRSPDVRRARTARSRGAARAATAMNSIWFHLFS